MIRDSGYFRRSIVQQILFLLFWFSGIGTSILMITLTRLISISFSDSIFTSAIVISGFFSGIAIGGYYFGKKIDTSNYEIGKFLFLEMGIGIYTILFFFIHPLTSLVYTYVFQNFGEHSFILAFYKFVFVFSFSIIPAIFIGGTFPVLSRFFIRSSANVGREVGNLYGLNLIGVSFGYFLTTFVFLYIFGLKQSLLFAALIFLFNAGIVQILLNKIGATISVETEFYNQKLKHLDPVVTVQSKKFNHIISISFGISGFIALAAIVLWYRSLVFVLGDNFYTFPIILTVFILAIASGAILFPRIFKSLKNLFPVFGVIQIVTGISIMLSVIILPQLPLLNKNLSQIFTGANAWSWQILIYFLDTILVIALPASFIGASFPVVGKTLISNFERRGHKVGVIFAINSIGAIAGLLIAIFVFIPNLGIQKSILINSLLSLLVGLVILFLAALKFGRLSKTFYLFIFVILVFFFSFFIPSNMISTLFHANKPNDKIIFALEGHSTTGIVHQDTLNNNLCISANGVYIDGTSLDFINQRDIQVQLPLLFHPNPDTVLLVGFGSGKSSQIALLHDVNKVYCTESHPEIVQISNLLNDLKPNSPGNNLIEIITYSGKNYLSLTDKKFDVIINTFIHPKYSSTRNLYTREYFENCKKSLAPDGIFSSMVPLNGISIEDFKILLRTFHTVFPATTIWYNNNWRSQSAVLLGFADTDQLIDFSRTMARIKRPEIHSSLIYARMENIYEILDCFVMGPEVIQKITGGVRLNRENKPVIEFSTSRTSDESMAWYQKIQLFKSYREFVYPYLTNIDSTFKQRQAVKFVLDNYFENSENIFNAIGYEILWEHDLALQLYRAIYIKNKSDQSAERFLDDHFNPYLIQEPTTPTEYAENAKIFYQKGSYEESITNFEKAIELDESYIPAYFGLGLNYEILGSINDAKKMYRKTLELKPNLEEAQIRLDSLLQTQKSNSIKR